MSLTIFKASRADLDDLLALLTEVGLPHEGVSECIDSFLIARDVEGRLAGCIGMERHGSIGLLRSAAVAPSLQRSGLGSHLTAALLDAAVAEGIEEVILLTTTARDFFARRFAFKEASRTDYEAHLAGSPEWGLPHCSSAVLMKLDLRKSELK